MPAPKSKTEVKPITRDEDLGVDDESGSKAAARSYGYNESIMTWFKKRNGETLEGALAFVPWVLQQAYTEESASRDKAGHNDNDGGPDGRVVLHQGEGAVMFSDASGFTKLTDELSGRSNGAELLSQCLQGFFTPLIDLINNYRGDVIKFSGNALLVYFQAVDDTKSPNYNCVVPPHGTYGLPDLGPMATAVLRASACCIEIHKRLHNWNTGIDGVVLSLHIGVGCGTISILQVGGEVPPATNVPQVEYFIAGKPLEQIRVAEPLAKPGETCLSPEAWEYVKDCVVQSRLIDSKPDYHLLGKMDESKYTFPTIKHAAMENDNRAEHRFMNKHLKILRKYIPSSVFKQIECGTLVYVNEMRNISVMYINGSGLDVMSQKGAMMAQELMTEVQKKCYQHEGTLNKFMIDDKGMLFLLVFGLPPLVHTDDPTRAVLSSFDMVKVFNALKCVGRFGVTTGRSYCGVCGSHRRMEYNVLGACVNLASRLMLQAGPDAILCDEETKNFCSHEVIFNALAPIKIKTKEGGKINVFQPIKKEDDTNIGLTRFKTIRFPWYGHPFAGGAKIGISNASNKSMQMNVQQLCSVKTWRGICAVNDMLGGAFDKKIHIGEHEFNLAGKKEGKAPEGSVFEAGGVVIISGQTGMGKIELAEHMVTYALLKLHILPVFGTMGPRPGDSVRMAVELLRSTIGVYRATAGAIPDNDYQALLKLWKGDVSKMKLLEKGLQDPGMKGKESQATLDFAIEVTLQLIATLIKTQSVILLLQFEYGTSLFPKSAPDQAIFWGAVTKFTSFVESEMKDGKKAGHQPLILMIVCSEPEDNHRATVLAKRNKTHLHLSGLLEENILEYMANYLNVPDHMIEPKLRKFVDKVTLGNPRHIRETIDQLLESNLQVVLGSNQLPKGLTCKELGNIKIATWHHTAMIGNTVCRLESLDPLEAAVLKMSTCFAGTFTLPDLAASTCSRWADATHFDFLRLFKAIRNLVDAKLIDEIDDDPRDEVGAAGEKNDGKETVAQNVGKFGKTQTFQTRNLLMLAVGGSMVLEAQKKSVKRQALIDRALGRELPGRMEALAHKRTAQHIPWYYEQAFRRMPGHSHA